MTSLHRILKALLRAFPMLFAAHPEISKREIIDSMMTPH